MKPRASATPFFNSHGQGTVEMTLLLVVSVSLILAFSQKIFKPFGEFTNAYMGEYLGCLLDKGALPRLGADDGDACSESFKSLGSNPFSPGNVRSQAGNTNPSGSNSAQKKSSEQEEVSNSRSGNSGRGTNRVISASNDRRYNTTRSADGAAANDKVTEVANPLNASKYYKVSNAGVAVSSGGKIIQSTGLSGLIAAEKKKLQRREEKLSKAGIIESEEDLGKPKRLVLKPPLRKVAEERAEEPLTFGRFFRLLIIVAIAIAIFVFLSGQVVQITKSWEK